MKDLIYNPDTFRKIEFWAATTIFVFAVFSLITSEGGPNSYLFEEENIPFYYYRNYFLPHLIQYTALYAAFWFLNFKVIPRLIQKEALILNAFFILITLLTIWLVFGVTDTYLKNYLFQEYESEQETYDFIFQRSFLFALWLLFIFGFYTVIKYAGIYLLSNSEAIQAKYRVITRDGLLAFVFWMVSMFFLLIADAERQLIIGWGIIGPSSIIFYLYSISTLIPVSLTKKKPFQAYLLRTILVLIIAYLPISLLGYLLSPHREFGFVVGLFNTFVQLFLTMPLSWVLFKRQMRGSEEVFVLKKELGRSNANLDFLRSQINPHFLFNSLNTLYGTALQENSERTAQGIQMLGDMMRFMLHENHQTKILLSREIEYMRNYIELQSLRTSTTPNIVIQTKIADVLAEKFIAPMLLIPFVENAFKHGISLKQKSWIKVTLHYEQDKLYFDVYNSTHAKPEQDPEKDTSGIGLENVKQRLALLYPNKHELVIRETTEEFFVHLTLQL